MLKKLINLFALIVFIVLSFLFPQKNVFAARSTPLIVDHNAVLQFDLIPDSWLNAAKENITLHYAHTSHGGQINSGILALEAANSKYGVGIKFNHLGSTVELPPQENPSVLRIFDGNPPEEYITPDDYWRTANGVSRTQAVANTGLFDFSMWSWCGEQSSNSIASVQQYLDQLNSFEAQYPNMLFIYMTGHTDGTQGSTNSTLRRNNQMIRDYALANNKVLFDFADIESWDPDGNHYPNTSDNCSWCTDWCSSHPNDCNDLAGGCAHSHPFNCKLKAKAFWWMMAKLAGWDSGGSLPLDPALLAFRIRFDGINSTTDPAPQKTVKITLLRNAQIIQTFETVSLNPVGNGSYSGTISQIEPGNYDFLIKSDGFLQKKFENINLSEGDNNQDWSNHDNFILKIGDFYTEGSRHFNVLNIYDVTTIINQRIEMETPVTSQNRRYDVNHDGIIDRMDITLVIANWTELEVRGD